MSLFTRITATVAASVDNAVSRVEDHNAIVEASLAQTRRAASSARVRLARVQKDHLTLRARREQLSAEIVTWTGRAKRCADDENRAIDCLARRKECREEVKRIDQRLADHAELENSLGEQVKRIQTRLRDINEQRNLLRTRESVAEANKIIESLDLNDTSNIERTFDRWEERIGEAELFYGSSVSHDPLESAFENDEARQELLTELEKIKEETE